LGNKIRDVVKTRHPRGIGIFIEPSAEKGYYKNLFIAQFQLAEIIFVTF
jgi:hypothetical protein